MEYQKIINLLDNTSNQPTKFMAKNCVEINHDAHGTYNTNSRIKLKTSMLRSSFCFYSDACIPVSRTITVAEVVAGGGNNNIHVVLKNCAPFTDYISKTNNTQIDNAKDIDVVMSMYNLIEHSDNYSKTSGSLWQYYRDEPALNDAGDPDNVLGNSASFKYEQKTTGSTGNNGKKAVKIIVPLKYLSNFQRTLEMLLNNCEINLILTWSANCVTSNSAAN